MLETFVRWSARPSGTVFTRQEIAERSGLDESLLDQVLAAASLGDLEYGYA